MIREVFVVFFFMVFKPDGAVKVGGADVFFENFDEKVAFEIGGEFDQFFTDALAM